MSGTDLSGTLTPLANDTVTLTAGATVWTVPVVRVVSPQGRLTNPFGAGTRDLSRALPTCAR